MEKIVKYRPVVDMFKQSKSAKFKADLSDVSRDMEIEQATPNHEANMQATTGQDIPAMTLLRGIPGI